MQIYVTANAQSVTGVISGRVTLTRKLLIKQRFHDQFLQSWMSEVYLNSICISYRIFKVNFGFEDYLIRLSPSLRRIFFKF